MGYNTVEGAIINTLEVLRLITNPKINRFRSASRTDKGVFALGNVIAFDCYHDLSIDTLRDLNEVLHKVWEGIAVYNSPLSTLMVFPISKSLFMGFHYYRPSNSRIISCYKFRGVIIS